MIPLYKLLSLLIRVFSRPIINYTKKKHLKQSYDDVSKLRRFFIWTGNFAHRIESRINRKFLKIQTELAFKPLNDQLACQKGIEFSYEIIFYAIIIGLPIYEMILASNEAKAKADKLQERLKSIEDQISLISTQLSQAKKQKPNIIQKQQNSQISQAANNVNQQQADKTQNIASNDLTEPQKTQKIYSNQQNLTENKNYEQCIIWTQIMKRNKLLNVWKANTFFTCFKIPNLWEVNICKPHIYFGSQSSLLKYTYL